MPRLFVAVRTPCSPALADLLDAFAPIRGVTPVKSQNLHYTLRFLGDVSDSVAHQIRTALQRRQIDTNPFTLTMEGVSAFPNPGDPRVLWVGCDNDAGHALRRIADDIDAFLDTLGLESRDKPFVPHLTVARIKRADSRGRSAVRRILKEHASTHFGHAEITCAALVESTLTPHGPVYEDLAEVPLT